MNTHAPPYTLAPLLLALAAPAYADDLALHVQGNHFVDGSGETLQLRGVNISALEFSAIKGLNPGNPWAGQTGDATPNWNAIRDWSVNTVRIPLNEASWLGSTCKDTSGSSIKADPGGNYRKTVEQAVKDATGAGLYVILDLHWTAPGDACPMLQTQMADADHSITFWTQVAMEFKSHPNVLFELYNEPFFNFDFTGDAWNYLMAGQDGMFTGYPATDNAGHWKDVKTPWHIASMQAMIDAVRATGAANIVLVGAEGYSQDLSKWLDHRPHDPANQLAAVWHAYPAWQKPYGSEEYKLPNFGEQAFKSAETILAAGIPVVVTEYGDKNAPGTKDAPFAATLLPRLDKMGASYLAWSWDKWDNPDHVLIRDGRGTPTDGFGQYVKQHYTCMAGSAGDCR
jgi:aryl-phospho-beta-D-glucosidase BglC (GH1 family)